MEMISEDKLRNIAGRTGFNLVYLEKDYFLTLLMELLKDVRGIYLKGGTALNKIFLEHTRLSEDLDFAANRTLAGIKQELEKLVSGSAVFTRLEYDKSTAEFIRYRVFYRSYFRPGSFIMVDINRKASIHLEPETHKLPNFYGLEFSVRTLNLNEILAEKIRALITRNQPRDYFDAYYILSRYQVNMGLVRKKTAEAGEKFDTERIFKNANRIYSRWDEDLVPLTNKKLGFLECMKLLEKKLR
jgi:predicted nucleotidyltransferase component of viral defense system